MSVRNFGYRAFQKGMFAASAFLDWTPPEVLKGPGAVKKLPALIKEQGLDNVLVVTDKGLMGLHLLDSLYPVPRIMNLDECKALLNTLRQGGK